MRDSSLETQAPVDTRQYSTFFVDGHLFGIEVLQVQEVLRYQEMTVVPLSSPLIRGLINLRGQIVVAICSRRSLGLPDGSREHLPVNIVLQSAEGAVSLLVDDMGEVVDVPLEARDCVPETIPQRQKDLIESVYHLQDGSLMLALNTARLLENACC